MVNTSLVPKSKHADIAHLWWPTATIETLRKRAQLIKTIRDFFATRGVLEVETPLMCHAPATDPFIHSLSVPYQANTHYYLQTSPEYAMKRLLASGSGPIFQITKAFRQDEAGQYHNPEFTMLEWYRVDFDHHDLMNEVDALLQLTLQQDAAQRIGYADAFTKHLQIDIHNASLAELAACANQHEINIATPITDRDTWLSLLMSHYIEPRIGQTRPCFIYDFPITQAALARIQPGNPPVASRFEVYYRGIELANGFHELKDASEQRARFENNLQKRAALGLAALPIDERLLTALDHGLPDCAGVALGIDRLVMLATQHTDIASVLSFDINRA